MTIIVSTEGARSVQVCVPEGCYNCLLAVGTECDLDGIEGSFCIFLNVTCLGMLQPNSFLCSQQGILIEYIILHALPFIIVN